ncbi:TlpA family protein disulfide reductase [Marinimicrobium alkaliphilum]|uniref:TlpA family protein disulfide reductase n=1 Tax=Marinimicrobium alkaliphilum TaxID=2202654 RepID=UPI000DB99B7E|nr:TlpA disulfide reductase family protein [Marinimicrobium alkaliphilum]
MTRLLTTLLLSFGLALSAHATEAPDFTLKSASGENLRLAEQRGQVVMINFWASWCPPCLQEMPLLDEIYQRYQPAGFNLLGINVEQDTAAAEALLEELGVSFPILFDPDNQVSRDYQVQAMPTTVLVDKNGVVRYVNRGYQPGDEDKYRAQVRELIRE